VHTPVLFYTRTVEKLHLERRKTTAAPAKTDTITGRVKLSTKFLWSGPETSPARRN